MLDIRPAGSICRFKRNKMDIKPSAALKKCLFGEPDHDSLKADLNTMMTEIQTNDRLRWDFNFTKGEPVEGGRYKWDKLPLPAKTHVLEDQPKFNIIGLKRGDDVTEIASTESSPTASPTISTCPQTTTVLCKGSPSTQRKLPGEQSAAILTCQTSILLAPKYITTA